jgi:GAF domain-containing protein
VGINESKYAFYAQLETFAKSLTHNETDVIANLSIISALLFDQMQDVNWAGFYMFKDEQLVLGPFQGKPACIRIPVSKGVCGKAARTLKPVLVKDVHEFDGHITCDAASNSEIVLPIVVDGKLMGVLDIDSPTVGRFEQVDVDGLLPIAELVQSLLK